jgi:hypothetical protein
VYATMLNIKIRKLMSEAGIPSITAQILALHHSWHGHAMRLQDTHPVKQLVKCRGTVWNEQQKKLPQRQRVQRAQQGNIKLHDWRFVQCHGDNWELLCMDRAYWKGLEIGFVAEKIGEMDTKAHWIPDAKPNFPWTALWQKALAPNLKPASLRNMRVFILCSDMSVIDVCVGVWRRKERLLQANFLLTHVAKASVLSPEGCFVRIDEHENSAIELARCAAALDLHAEHDALQGFDPSLGGSLVACAASWWGPAGGAIASAIWWVSEDASSARMSTAMHRVEQKEGIEELSMLHLLHTLLKLCGA